MARKWIVEIICYLFVLLFVYTGVSKYLDYYKFLSQIKQSPLLQSWGHAVAILLPAAEFIVSLMLVIPKIRMVGLYASLCLMTMFTSYIIAILQFGDHIPCTCGGIIQQMSWEQHLVFNFVFLFLSIVAIVLQSNIEIVENRSFNSLPVK
ncbi:MauE/DoxX family redox-associated membrane protein [Chitinophaga niabensis]|uniref:MauE/DoxX family redox-associated membrane protein n=1 Tax=Chitinophaga niabensis TaxID=536979 RepID=UPI0031BA068A